VRAVGITAPHPPSVAVDASVRGCTTWETDAHGRIADDVGPAPGLGQRMRWSPAFASTRSNGL